MFIVKERSAFGLPGEGTAFDPEFRQYILDFRRDQLPVIEDLIRRYQTSKRIVVFHAREEADAWIDRGAL